MASGKAMISLEDRREIEDVLVHLCYLIDTFQIERLDEVYTEDGSDDHGGGPVVGWEAIKAWYADSTANVAAAAHNVTNLWVEPTEGGATARSSVTAWIWTMDGPVGEPMRPASYALSLRYFDTLVSGPSGWRVKSRVLVPNVSKTNVPYLVAVGKVPTTQSGIHSLSRRRP